MQISDLARLWIGGDTPFRSLATARYYVLRRCADDAYLAAAVSYLLPTDYERAYFAASIGKYRANPWRWYVEHVLCKRHYPLTMLRIREAML